MNYFGDENRIIEFFQRAATLWSSNTDPNDELAFVFESIRQIDQWTNWINSAGHGAPPPDFYNDKLKLMMDVMRIDDHGFVSPKGKVVNPVNQRENLIQRELEQAGILAMFPKVDAIFVNAITDLPTHEDHNYGYYFTNFKRTVEKHIQSIPLYRRNHPDYKVIFFIMDESSGYMQVENEDIVREGPIVGKAYQAIPHIPCYDKRFVEVFRNSDIEYIIWFMPFKELPSDTIQMPKAYIIDVHEIIEEDLIDYPKDLMMSKEA